MNDDQSFDELDYAIITSVVRDGSDVIMTFRNAQHRLRVLSRCRFIATLRLVKAHRINSWAPDAPTYEARLEPGWKVSTPVYDGLSLRLAVHFQDMHMSYYVYHRVWCEEAKLRLAFDPHGTFMAYYFHASYTSAREPPPSPPIEGQEGPIGT